MQECFDATRAENFDPRNNGPITWCPGRHVDVSKLDAGGSASPSSRANFERISEDLHSFGVLEPHAQLPERTLTSERDSLAEWYGNQHRE
jgi:hypothetical protein